MKYLFELKKYFYRYRKTLYLGILFILIANFAQVSIPMLLRESIDQINIKENYSRLYYYAMLIVGAALLSGLFRFLIRQTVIVVSRKIEYDLRHDFWEHIQKLSLNFFQNNSAGNLMAHATNDISAVRMFAGPAVMYSIDTVTKFLIVIVIMTAISPALTLYTLLPLPLLSWFVYKLSKKIHKKFTRIQEKFSDITTKAQESFSGIRVIKSYIREESEIEEFRKLGQEYLERNMDKVKIQALFQPILYLISGLSIIIVISAGGFMVIEGSLTLGDISAFVIYLGLLIWPMIAFGWVVNIIQQADASMKRIKKLLDKEPSIKESYRTSYLINNLKGNLKFDNVSFQYRKDLPLALKNINLDIKAGETVSFIGHTGSGKSSLVSLIPRLYDVTSGTLLIDGRDVREIPLSVLRRNIGFVTQETFLFSDKLEKNILYGGDKFSDDLLYMVAAISRINKDVDGFPQGYDTILGERGITLSGGQKQRTSIARALAINPKVLILDDSFSAVDTATEEEILGRLKEYRKGLTNIIISHRISTVKNSDRIYVVNEGEIAEEGTHDELIEANGLYAELHYKQLLEEELKGIN